MSKDRPKSGFLDKENPFLKLDKQAFPQKPGLGARPEQNKGKRLEQAAPETDDESALFLRAMQHCAPKTASAGIRSLDDEEAWQTVARSVRTPVHGRKKPMLNHRHSGQPAPNPDDDPESPDVFAQAMRDVRPLAGKGREVAPPAKQPAAAVPTDLSFQDMVQGKLEFATHYTDEYVEGHVLGLDLVTVGKLQAGQFSPEAHLDLHGLNALQAYQRLVGFMRNAYHRNQRTVLLVPGRGLNSPNGVSVLRDKVQTWLTQEPFRRVVLAFCTAQPSDGGAGALYVLLRKFRKDQGKVHWDRVPVDPDLLMD